VQSSLAAITGGDGNEDALQKLLAAKRSALMQRLDPDGQYEAALLHANSPLHHRALSPSKDRFPAATAFPRPLPASSASADRDQNAWTGGGSVLQQASTAQDQTLSDGGISLHGLSPLVAGIESASPHLNAAGSPAARRLAHFAAVDARLSQTIRHIHDRTHAAAAAAVEQVLPGYHVSASRPVSAASTRSFASSVDGGGDDAANRAETYYLQVQVDNFASSFADRFDCVIATHEASEGGRRPLTASFPQLLMSKDRYLLFPCKPKMWRGLPTDKVFGSGVARMTDFDPRTVLSLSEYLPWVEQPRQLLGCSLRLQVFSRVKRDNGRRCVVDKLITFNDDFTVHTVEYPGGIKGTREGQVGGHSARRRPQSAMI
jgi:hypothetical protein